MEKWAEELKKLREFCSDAHEREDTVVVHRAVALATKYTRSNIGFISVVHHEDETYLDGRLRFIVNPIPQVMRYQHRQSLRIGKDLPKSERSLSGYVAYTKEAYLCKNVEDDHYYLSIDDDVASELVAPIVEPDVDQMLGVINLESYKKNHYKEKDKAILCEIATLIANPLARIVAGEQEEYASFDFAKLCEKHFSTSQGFLFAALQQIARRVKATRAYARVVDGDQLWFRACYPQELGNERLQFHQALLFPISIKELERQPSFAGYVAYTQEVQRIADIRDFSYYKAVREDLRHPDEEIKAALGVPIRYDDARLGVITLFHNQEAFYKTRQAQYLHAFASRIAVPLYGLLASERYRVSHQTVRIAIKCSLKKLGTEDPFETHHAAHAVAHQIAAVMKSQLCTIWLINSDGELAWHGAHGLASEFPALREDEINPKAVQAIQDTFQVSPTAFCPETVVPRGTAAWHALKTLEMINYGANGSPKFLQRNDTEPFLIVPMQTQENQLIGIIHIGLREQNPVNPHGFYSAADERLLEGIQMEIVNLYELQRLRTTAEYAVLDLHNTLGLLTYDLLYGIDNAKYELGLQDLLHTEFELDELEHKTQSFIRELRSIMLGLKSQALEEKGLRDALQQFINTSVMRRGLRGDFVFKGTTVRLPIKVTWQLYRIAQEALTNVIKHANADYCVCTLDIKATVIKLSISDNGQGLDPEVLANTNRCGLKSIRKRTEDLGGELKLERKSPTGTVVTVTIPRGG